MEPKPVLAQLNAEASDPDALGWMVGLPSADNQIMQPASNFF